VFAVVSKPAKKSNMPCAMISECVKPGQIIADNQLNQIINSWRNGSSGSKGAVTIDNTNCPTKNSDLSSQMHKYDMPTETCSIILLVALVLPISTVVSGVV